MQSIKRTTTGSDWLTERDACFSKVGLKWDKLVGVTTDCCPNSTAKNVGLLKRVQDQVIARNQKQKLVFLYYTSGNIMKIGAKN